MKNVRLAIGILCLLGFSACRYPQSFMQATLNTNLEVVSDSILLTYLPVKESFDTLRKGERVVVAEYAIHPTDSIDSLWVKLAHSQQIQGWISKRQLMEAFVPTDSISQFIYLFSHTHLPYFVVTMALFCVVWLYHYRRRHPLPMVYFNDIDSPYPLLLCLLMATGATVYESIQIYAPALWEQYYFTPTLSPFDVPAALSAFLLLFWIFLLVLMAAIDDIFRHLPPLEAMRYTLGMLSACIFCYFFFVLTTQVYVGYLFLLLFFGVCLRRIYRQFVRYKYRCGNCGAGLRHKGVCWRCGAWNE
ncbi:MAG: hypothetical protein LBM06_05740 [Prevotellaceae bacterium]|jgi:hypothetical protein|nr:hypothetical protein [Prevotellaceae bacterium]